MDRLRNAFYYSAGLAVLGLTCLRHRVQGYRNPTDFPASDWPRSIRHVTEIVEDWRGSLAKHAGRASGFEGLRVLELGPGATLGTGVLLVGLGARSYQAVDAFALAASTPPGFYRALAESDLPEGVDRARMRQAIEALEQGREGPVSYVVDPGFDVARAVGGRRFDLIVSNAVFEHFDDVERTIAQLGEVAAPGALFIAMVDFQTHSRLLRGADPNNIYRYGEGLYRLLAYPGQPNRRRPDDYVHALARSGWTGTQVHPVDVAAPGYQASTSGALDRGFRSAARRMEVLTGIIVANRPQAAG